MEVESHTLTWALVLPPPTSGYVTLGEQLPISESQFPHL